MYFFMVNPVVCFIVTGKKVGDFYCYTKLPAIGRSIFALSHQIHIGRLIPRAAVVHLEKEPGSRTIHTGLRSGVRIPVTCYSGGRLPSNDGPINVTQEQNSIFNGLIRVPDR